MPRARSIATDCFLFFTIIYALKDRAIGHISRNKTIAREMKKFCIERVYGSAERGKRRISKADATRYRRHSNASAKSISCTTATAAFAAAATTGLQASDKKIFNCLDEFFFQLFGRWTLSTVGKRLSVSAGRSSFAYRYEYEFARVCAHKRKPKSGDCFYLDLPPLPGLPPLSCPSSLGLHLCAALAVSRLQLQAVTRCERVDKSRSATIRTHNIPSSVCCQALPGAWNNWVKVLYSELDSDDSVLSTQGQRQRPWRRHCARWAAIAIPFPHVREARASGVPLPSSHPLPNLSCSRRDVRELGLVSETTNMCEKPNDYYLFLRNFARTYLERNQNSTSESSNIEVADRRIIRTLSTCRRLPPDVFRFGAAMATRARATHVHKRVRARARCPLKEHKILYACMRARIKEELIELTIPHVRSRL
uniref:Uncharacterized protein n=1 Tax=Trichogramma kaykai TaxID=54128 RepID=A0ABD2W5A5_9HYME